ncbi:DUF397 domain-containing protein [Streptomyces sp. NPDC004610]|uniref:DUF397 domain-containing protein n=1 Tax=unclassified Streptomyces TaxID=2593676 RepID=UPI0033B25BCB
MNTSELAWYRSSYSTASGDNCVEIALSWRKSSHSSTASGDCVEIATSPFAIHVRDSKSQADPQLALSPGTWGAFITHLTS